jgi:sugar phosphate isomerase/epimerase
MEIGIFSRTFARPTLDGVLDAVLQHNLRQLQFNLTCAGLPAMPDRLEENTLAQIRQAFVDRGLVMAAVSGTFNMIHPDAQQRADGLRQLAVIIGACARLGTSIVTLCTGTRDPANMWRWHPDSYTPDAWHDLTHTLAVALAAAEEHKVTLGVETEVSNVIDSAHKARRLLDEMRSPYLKIIMDGANFFHKGELPRMREILDEAFELLGADVVLAHAKDLSRDGEAGHEAAGAGKLDYDHYIALLRRIGYTGPLILHSLSEEQVPGCVAFLQSKL